MAEGSIPVGAILTVAGVVIAALLGLFGVLIGQLYARIARLESKLNDEVSYANKLWAYTRELLDMYFTHRKPGAPNPGPIPDRGDL